MTIIRKGYLIRLVFLVGLLLPLSSFADAILCGSEGCGPCGASCGNSLNGPSYSSCGVNPFANYVATTQPDACRGYWSGVYVGVAYGFGWVSYDLEVNGSSPSYLNTNTRSYLTTIVDAGFNLVLERFFIGIEGGYNYRSRTNQINYLDVLSFMQTTTDTSSATVFPCKTRFDINSQHAVTADLLPGFAYNRFVVYLRLGVEQTKYTLNRRVCFPSVFVDTTDPGGQLIIVEGADFSDSFTSSATGYRLGAGFGYAFTVHLSAHLNYIHTFGNKLTFTPATAAAMAANAPVLITGEPTTTTVSIGPLIAPDVIEPQRNEVNFGFKFRF